MPGSCRSIGTAERRWLATAPGVEAQYGSTGRRPDSSRLRALAPAVPASISTGSAGCSTARAPLSPRRSGAMRAQQDPRKYSLKMINPAARKTAIMPKASAVELPEEPPAVLLPWWGPRVGVLLAPGAAPGDGRSSGGVGELAGSAAMSAQRAFVLVSGFVWKSPK